MATASGTAVLPTSRTYDALDRLDAETTSLPDGGSRTVRYAYFGNGTRQSVTDPAGTATSYTYDAQNRLATATTAGGTTSYAYYPDDLLRSVSYPNGVRADHAYDRANRLVSLANTRGGSTVSAYAYGYDANGNRLSQTETNGGRTETTGYTYDALDRLATVSYPADGTYPNGRVVTYGYDPVGNRIQELERTATGITLADKQGIFDSLNRLQTLTDASKAPADPEHLTSFGWDANGNQVAKTVGEGAAAVTTTYAYDARDKLVEVRQGASVLGRFQYDFEGRRTKKIGEEGLRQYVYDDTSLLVEYDASGMPKAKYDYGSDRLIALTRADEGRRYFSLDGLRSVVNLTDDAGAPVASDHLDAWGNFRFPSELDSSRNRFAFTGHIYDDETGLYNAKARYFDPKLGRFLTQDSYLGQIDQPPSLHRYLYANDNPVVYWDPDGHQPGRAAKDTPADDGASAAVADAKAYLAKVEAQGPQPWDEAAQFDKDAPPTVVQEEGWLAKASRKYEEGWNWLSQHVSDGWDAMARSMFHPSASSRYQPGLFPKPEEQAGRELSQRNIGQEVQETAGEGAQLGGAGWVAGTRILIEAEAANQAGEAVAGGAGRAKQLLRSGGRELAADARVAKTTEQAIAADRRAAQSLGYNADAAAPASVAAEGKALRGTQNPETAWATRTGRAYDRRVTRFWRQYEGRTVGGWNVESVNRRLAPGIQPDLVLVNEEAKTIVIHDVTSKAAASHMAKGAGYKAYFEVQRPGYAVKYSEGYWEGLENSWEALDRHRNLYLPSSTKP